MMEGIFKKKMMERGHFIFYIFLHVVSLIRLVKKLILPTNTIKTINYETWSAHLFH
jgi:hypothetical protein